MRTHSLQCRRRKDVARISTLRYLFALFMAATTFAANDVGYGPPISVPHELPKAAVQFKRSLVDQTWDDARSKSSGCLECHKGIDTLSMHTSPNVVLEIGRASCRERV